MSRQSRICRTSTGSPAAWTPANRSTLTRHGRALRRWPPRPRPADRARHERTGGDVRLETADFTTHGVIVGMTGSGKTGLGVVIIEEVLSAGLPALLIDPKGDLTNLCLTFPDLAPESFRPWIDEAQANAAGQTLTSSGRPGRRLEGRPRPVGLWTGTDQKLRDTCDFTIYTPGSRAGQPIEHRRLAAGSRHRRPRDDRRRDRGVRLRTARPGQDRGRSAGQPGAHPAVERDPARVVEPAGPRPATLVGQVQQPPIDKLGVFELDQFFPPKDRQKLAMQLNGLLASPSFAAWGDGTPLEVQELLYRPTASRAVPSSRPPTSPTTSASS